jgi:hypothetical protein
VPVLKVVGGLFGLLAWLFFLGLQRVWRSTFGWLFTTLADLLDAVHIPIPHFADPHPFGNVAAWLRSLNRNVSHALAVAADASEHLAVWLFSRVRLAFAWIGREIEHLAADVLHMGLWVVRVYVPRLIRKLTHQIVRGWAMIWKYLRSQLPAIWRLLKRYGRSIAHQAGVELHHWVKGLRAFAWLEGKLLRFVRAASRRLVALERRFVPRGMRKWLAALFPIFGIAWLLGQSWKRLGEGILRWSWNMVGAFLAYFGRLDGAHSIDTLTHQAERLMPIMIHEVEFLISEFNPSRLAPGPVKEPPIV